MKIDKSLYRFVLTGGSSTLIDFIIYYFMSNYIDISIAKCISLLCSSVYSYYLNKRWTFENDKKSSATIVIRYYVTFAINMIVNISINRCIFNYSHNRFIAFIFATGTAMIVNYILQKKWVFTQHGKEPSDD